MNALTIANRSIPVVPPVASDPYGVVREMMSNLDNLTVAGQQHVMAKIIRFVEVEAAPVLRGMRARHRLAVSELLAGLRHETARLCPDAASFVRRGEAVIGLLGTLA
jgi:hypothetical protein